MPYLHSLNLIRKKMNSWHLTSRLTARSFSESTASRVRSGRCPRQCATLLLGQMYLQEKTPVLQFGHALEQNFFNLSHHFLSMDGWPGDAIFFLWGQPLKIIHRMHPISCPGALTHCLLDFWKIVFFKKRTEPPGKKTGSTEEDLLHTDAFTHSCFYTLRRATWTWQFYLSFWWPNLLSCERVVTGTRKSQFT